MKVLHVRRRCSVRHAIFLLVFGQTPIGITRPYLERGDPSAQAGPWPRVDSK